MCTMTRVLNAVDCFTALSLLAYVNKVVLRRVHTRLSSCTTSPCARKFGILSAVLAGGGVRVSSRRSHASDCRVLHSR